MFLPIKSEHKLQRFPVLTTLVCVICALVFFKQQSDRSDFEMSVMRYCMKPQSRIEEMVMSRVDDLTDSTMCGESMFHIAHSEDPGAEIDEIVQSLKPLSGFNASDSREYVTQMLKGELAQFRTLVPAYPDTKVAYYTGSWNPVSYTHLTLPTKIV